MPEDHPRDRPDYGVYCLKVIIARPDYKRPSVRVIVEHFSTEVSAQARLNEIKEEYIGDYFDEDSLTIDEFDTMLKDGSVEERVYADAYMDMPPFDAKIFRV